MKRFLRRMLSLLLSFALALQLAGISQESYIGHASSFISVEEYHLDEQMVAEEQITAEQLTSEWIVENLIYEEGLYEYRLGESLVCETYIVEATVGVTTTEEIFGQLPPGIDDYDIDWPAVIGKFAVGTAIIITVGIINHVTAGSTYFFFASPAKVAKDALIGGGLETALGAVIECVANGETCDRAVMKYAIEGFADGFMWGAITSVLSIAGENYHRLKQFQSATGGKLRIRPDGTVFDLDGNPIGRAYYGKDRIWSLVDNNDHIRLFDESGEELVGSIAEEILAQSQTGLPQNTKLRLGTDDDYKLCYTDDNGTIFRIDNSLQPNAQYSINNAIYHTDDHGRIVRAEFSVTELRQRARMPIDDSSDVIGRGEWRNNDERGHLVADWFEGDNTMANIVAQSPEANRQFSAVERNIANAVSNGASVRAEIVISYSEHSFRPTGFNYAYDAGEGLIARMIMN